MRASSAVGYLLLGAGLPVTVARLARPGVGTPAPQLAAFAPYAGAVLLPAAALLAGGRRPGAACVAAGAAALHGSWLLRRPGGVGRPGRGPVAAGPPLRVLTVNALLGRADAGAVAAAVRRLDVDLLAVQELPAGLVGRLAAAGLDDLLPHRRLAVLGRHGTGIWSRHPLRPLPPPKPGTGFPTVVVELTVTGTVVTVAAVHPLAPVPGGEGGWARDLDILTTAATGWAAARPVVVLGDWNASSDHASFRRLLAVLDDAADRVRAGRAPTWPAHRWFGPLFRLDHVLVGTAVGVTAVETLDVPGSDHRGVYAALVLPVPPSPGDGAGTIAPSGMSAGR